jgi:hypothetical protein
MNSKFIIACGIIFGMTCSTVAQTVYLQGYVSYKNGRPAKQASIHLFNKQPTTQTDAVGFFTLYGNINPTASLVSHTQLPRFSFSIASNRIKFSVPGPGSSVIVELFDLSGKKCATLANGSFPAGEISIPLRYDSFGNTLYLVRARMGGVTQTLRVPLVKSPSAMIAASNASDRAETTRLAKVAKKPQDTLVVLALDGAMKLVPVDSIYGSNPPLLIIIDNPTNDDSPTDDALASFPVVSPIMQQHISRQSWYSTEPETVQIQPAFSAEILAYTVEGSDSIIGIRPVARSQRASITVSLDGMPWFMSPWLNAYSPTEAVYSCSLASANTPRIFSTTVTPHDGGQSKTYNLTMKRN